MQLIPDKSVDMILCDLPYGTTACKWDTIIPFEPVWEQYKRIIKDNGAIVLTASQPFTSALVMSNVKMFKYEWVWEKERPTNIFLMKKQCGKVHENILVFYKEQPTYNPIIEPSKQPKNNQNNKSQIGEMNSIETLGKTKTKISETYNPQTRNPRSVIKINRGTRGNSKLHPTQKPVALFEYLIKTYTNEGDLVLDNCAGSGTTGVACKNLNRNYILIEKEPKYIEIIKNRLV
jgi:site-specific DNA-methyltransferase (adenine-specific)